MRKLSEIESDIKIVKADPAFINALTPNGFERSILERRLRLLRAEWAAVANNRGEI